MDKANLSSRYSARPLGICQGGRVPGPSPQRGPPSAARGHLTSSCQARRQGARVRDTDLKETPTSRGINVLQWNAEGVYKKKIALTEKLHKENISVTWLEETHLKENQRFTMRGYQVFRHDREDRAKGGVAILVKNTIPAHEFTVSTNNQAEIHGASIIINEKQYKIFKYILLTWQRSVSRPHSSTRKQVHCSWRLQQSLRGMGLWRSRPKRRGSRRLAGRQWPCSPERSW